jgi:hypothetical protein
MLLNDLVTSWNQEALRNRWDEVLELVDGTHQPSWLVSPCAPRAEGVAREEDEALESVKSVVRFLDRVVVLLLEGRISSSLVHEMLGREFYSARAPIRTLAEDWVGWGYWINTGMRERLRVLEDVVWGEAVRLNTVFPPELADAVGRHKRLTRSGVKGRRRVRREARALGGIVVAHHLASRLAVSELPTAGRRLPPSIALSWCLIHRAVQRLSAAGDRRSWVEGFEETDGGYRINPTRSGATPPMLQFGGGTHEREIYRGSRELKTQMWWTASNGPVAEENFVIWELKPAKGTYSIEAYVPRKFASAKARYSVHRRGVATKTFVVEQEMLSGRWAALGSLITVNGSTVVTVRLSDCGDERRKIIGIGPIRFFPRPPNRTKRDAAQAMEAT